MESAIPDASHPKGQGHQSHLIRDLEAEEHGSVHRPASRLNVLRHCRIF